MTPASSKIAIHLIPVTPFELMLEARERVGVQHFGPLVGVVTGAITDRAGKQVRSSIRFGKLFGIGGSRSLKTTGFRESNWY